ncbi:MAG TPA: LacI family DNA-binding transcriptional regulator [Acidobacteriaceae bacterium]|nr:LacI family DNA-binding transcriptional regulator [Acidobacteriaceae bacterium]
MDMRELAKLAGVSSATVSRVINGSDLVRPATAEKVRRVIDELKFVPNGSATTLKQGHSSSYGLIIPDITNPFFPEFIRSFESILVGKKQDMLMATTDLHASRMQQTIHRMLVRQVEGVALLASEIETEPIETLIRNRVPLVTMDRRLVGPGLSDVSVHYQSGMRQTIEHLAKLGHKKIAYIGASAGLTISDHREQAFRKAMQKAGLKADPQFIRPGNYRITGGETAMMELLQLPDRPTAIVGANDLTAIGALRVLHRENLAVPKDISVVGFDDIELCDVFFPPLTTMRLPRHELAETFVTALESAAQEPHAVGKQYSVKTSLVIRNSTGPVKKK